MPRALGLRLTLVVVELGERVLGLPLQKNVALGILLNLAIYLLRLLGVVHARGDVSLN
jgi:hypothetical protein